MPLWQVGASAPPEAAGGLLAGIGIALGLGGSGLRSGHHAGQPHRASVGGAAASSAASSPSAARQHPPLPPHGPHATPKGADGSPSAAHKH